MMKKIFLPVIAIALFAASCQKEDASAKAKLGLEISNLSSPIPVTATDNFYESQHGQTPIDIRESAAVKDLSNDPVFYYESTSAVVKYNKTHYAADPNGEIDKEEHDEWNLKVIPSEKKSYITINGEKYYLAQFHFHYGSEHALNGRKYDMEVHFVHQADDGHLAVVGVFIEKGQENEILHEIFEASPHDKNAVDGSLSEINPSSLLPKDLKHYFTYAGSLTTPGGGVSQVPYFEGLKWFVFKSAISVGKEEYAHYTEDYEEPNARPLQPVGNRVVLVHGN